MNKIMLMYPPGKLYQRGEDRAQSNIEDSATASVHACNDLGYCASVLRCAGYEVFLRDYQTEKVKFKAVMNDVLRFQPDIIFLSTTNATVLEDLCFIAKIKQYYKCLFFVKGAIFYNPPPQALKVVDFSDVTCLIGGEIEFIIKPLADYYLKNKGSLESISGIIYQENGTWVKTAFDCWYDDLDSLPFPARDLMRNELYVRPDTDEPMATISVARGCPSQCIYCLTPIISGKKVRFRSVKNVFAEIEECYYKFGIKSFFFKADTFTINKHWAMELCDRIIRSDLCGKIAFTVNARADTVTPHLLSKMKRAGCFMLAIGFESGSNETLKRIKKGTTVADNLRTAKMVQKAGIPLFGFFMVGFPWETKADIKQTVRHIFEINPDFVELHIAMPYFGTELYEQCKLYNTLTNFSYGFDYYSPNTRGTKYITMQEIEQIKSQTLWIFYTRPGYICKKVFESLKEPVVVRNYLKYGSRLIRNTFFGR